MHTNYAKLDAKSSFCEPGILEYRFPGLVNREFDFQALFQQIISWHFHLCDLDTCLTLLIVIQWLYLNIQT